MITDTSPEHEIRDLQRLLIAVGHLDWTIDATGGIWGEETQAAVEAGRAPLGAAPPDGRGRHPGQRREGEELAHLRGRGVQHARGEPRDARELRDESQRVGPRRRRDDALPVGT